ncbi:MAG TPA: S1 RNA-binding domain-containing protein [Microthrixaceae bacterium]|nr:S1 RNA-binding domain-containing protein [Microthrixaceae bacterium]
MDRIAPPAPGSAPHPAHIPTVVDVEVTAVRPDELEVKLADGRVGVISRKDFTDTVPGTGDQLEAALLLREESKGRVALSHAWARKHRAWERLEQARAEHLGVVGTAKRVVKGGLVVEIDGLRAFLPSSLIDDHPVDPEQLVGTEVEVVVVDADQAADRLIVSRRELVRRERRQKQKEVMGSLEAGQQVRGTIVELLEFGARVDLGGGVHGLVHRSELTWGRVTEVADVVSVGDAVDVVVMEVNRSRRRVALSIRRLSDDPLAAVSEGDVGEAEITRLVEYGAFARLSSGAEGLIHLSELSELPVSRPEDLVVPGDRVTVKVIEVDRERRRVGLSIRQALLA